MKKEKVVCFTGHRKINKEKENQIRERLRECIVSNILSGSIYFACGGAIGFDMIAAEEVLKLKREYPFIHLILLLPFPNYTSKWPDSEKIKLKYLLKHSIFKYVSNCYSKNVYLERDDKLIEDSSVCICYLNKKEHSGTKYTVTKAIKNNLFVTNIADDNLWYDDFFEESRKMWWFDEKNSKKDDKKD